MKRNYPTQISQDNFEAVWSFTDHEYRQAKKKYVTTKIAPFFSNMVFALLIVFAGNGLVYNHAFGSYRAFLREIPYFEPTWKLLSGPFLKYGQSWQIQLTVTAVLIYLICFLICGVFVLLVTAIYHPKKHKLPTSSAKENASQLLTFVKEARRYANNSGDRGSTFWTLIFMLIVFSLFSFYSIAKLRTVDNMICTFVPGYDPTSLTDAMTGLPLMLIFMMLYGFLLFIGYSILNLIHAMSVQFMYKYTLPYSFVADVEYYYTFADEEIEGLTEEEIKAKRKEAAEAKRIEALDLERIGAYGKAKALLAEAAHGGDVAAMEHYGRHWLVVGAKDPGKYWLQKCVDSGEASEYAVKTLKRLKWHLKYQAKYLK